MMFHENVEVCVCAFLSIFFLLHLLKKTNKQKRKERYVYFIRVPTLTTVKCFSEQKKTNLYEVSLHCYKINHLTSIEQPARHILNSSCFQKEKAY